MKTGENKIQHIHCVLIAVHRALCNCLHSKAILVDSLAKAIWTSQVSVSPPSPCY